MCQMATFANPGSHQLLPYQDRHYPPQAQFSGFTRAGSANFNYSEFLEILAALQTIPAELYEAARVDGANPWQCFTRITFPLVGRMVWFIGFLAFVWNYNIFDLIWLTTKGGPGNTTQTLPVLIYRRAFKTFRPGEASSIAVIIVIFLAAVGLVYFKLLAPKKEERVIV
jgi:multiple sugar transport system permease protein